LNVDPWHDKIIKIYHLYLFAACFCRVDFLVGNWIVKIFQAKKIQGEEYEK